MGRIVVIIAVALSLAFGGVANAMAAQNCPYNKIGSTAHDCCPPTGHHKTGTSDKDGKSQTCKLGQACRTVPAVTPQLVDTKFVQPTIRDDGPAFIEASDRSSPLFSFWRPPRAA
ncbi:MAG: hypothetical protein GC155_15905 [Alphaproteobacteria bacterium]|nr:hypothetical protein [Alphaproteobacteria bacterium]